MFKTQHESISHVTDLAAKKLLKQYTGSLETLSKIIMVNSPYEGLKDVCEF
jgi:hypothetical protein